MNSIGREAGQGGACSESSPLHQRGLVSVAWPASLSTLKRRDKRGNAGTATAPVQISELTVEPLPTVTSDRSLKFR